MAICATLCFPSALVTSAFTELLLALVVSAFVALLLLALVVSACTPAESFDFAVGSTTVTVEGSLSAVVVSTERAFSDGVAFLSASTFAVSFSATCFLSNSAVFDSVTDVLKADTVSACASTSA